MFFNVTEARVSFAASSNEDVAPISTVEQDSVLAPCKIWMSGYALTGLAIILYSPEYIITGALAPM